MTLVPAPPAPARDISWMGLAGGLLGVALLGALGVDVAINPSEAGRWVAAIPFAMAAIYLPAIWVSVTPSEKRQAVQKTVVVASLVMVSIGLSLFGSLAFGTLLVIPTTLLATASGLIFQGRRTSR